MFLDVLAEPAVVEYIDDLDAERVEVVVDGDVELLLEVELRVEDLARGEHVGRTDHAHEQVVVEGEVLHRVDLEQDLAEGVAVRLVDREHQLGRLHSSSR